MTDYGTTAGFRSYHTARGRDVEDYGDAAIDAAKLIASEWVDGTYHSGFGGLKVGQRDQVREWPRVGAFDRDGYAIASDVPPVEVDSATYEAALRQLITPGSLSLDYTPSKYKRVSVDGAVSAEFNSFYTAADVQTQFKVIDDILAPILTGCADVSMLSGSSARA